MFSNLILGLAAASALDSSALEPRFAQETAPQNTSARVPAVAINPTWRNPPAPTDADYPTLAMLLGLNGRASVTCLVNTQGVPSSCTATAIPEGLGFETAAVNIAQRGSLRPKVVNGVAVESSISFSVPFNNDTEMSLPETVWDGPSPTAAQKLTGLIYAQSLANESTFDVESEWGLSQLSAQNRDDVLDWIRELYIGGVNINMLSNGIAMVIAKRGNSVLPPLMTPDRTVWIEEVATAIDSIFTIEANMAPLKERYCATNECSKTSN